MADRFGTGVGSGGTDPSTEAAAPIAATPTFWKEIVSVLPEGVIVVDPGGLVVLVNQAFCRMVGFGQHDLLAPARSLPCWLPQAAPGMATFFDLATRGEPTQGELVMCRQDGERFPARIGVARFIDGATPYVLLTVRDMTEQKRAEESHRSEAQRWRAMAENPYDFVTIVDENFKYVYVNHTAPGIRKEDLIGKRSPLDYIDAPYQPVMREALMMAFAGSTTSCEVFSDKLAQWFSTIVTPVFVDDRVSAVSLLTRNIHQAKRAEQARRESEHRLELALAGGDVGMFDLDVESGAVYCSPRLFEMLGHEASSAPTVSGALETFQKMIHPDDVARLFESAQRALKSGNPFDEEYRLRRKDGSYGWFHGRGRLFEVAGRTRFTGFATDITARKKAEQERADLEVQLRNVQKLDTLGRLAAGLAHDLNNLLVPILGNAQIVLAQLTQAGTMRGSLDDIVRAATQARELVARILVFGRQSEESETPVYVPDVVREAMRFLQGSLPSGVDVAVTFDEECPGVLGRPAQIQQAVMNLCTNALQAMSANGGRMSVTVGRFVVEPSFAQRHSLAVGPAVRIIVEDTGPGMTAEVLERAFDPFFTTKPLGQGSGLGLSIVHGIVGKHGGVVVASSRLGEGARFEVYLPARPAKAIAAAVASASEAPPGRKLRVLCVDDEPAVLRVLAQVLQRAGHEVTITDSPREALHKVKAHPNDFDLVITDQTMPQITGVELASMVYDVRPELPVILVSGYAETEWVKSATPNVRSFVRKPFDTLELAKAVLRAPA